MFSKHLKSQEFQFLSHFWTSDFYPKEIQESCINYSYFILNELHNVDGKNLIPYYLIGLFNESKRMRKISLQCLEIISKEMKGDKLYVIEKDTQYSTKLNKKEVETFLNDLLSLESSLKIDKDGLVSFFKKKVSDTMVSFLCEHICKLHVSQSKLFLLKMMKKYHSSLKLKKLTPLVEFYLKTNKLEKEELKILKLLIEDYKIEYLIKYNEKEHFNAFMKIGKHCHPLNDDFTPTSILFTFERKEFEKLDQSFQKEMFDLIVYCLNEPISESFSIQTSEILKNYPFDSSFVLPYFTGFKLGDSKKIDEFVNFVDNVRFMENLKNKETIIAPCFKLLKSLKEKKGSNFIFKTNRFKLRLLDEFHHHFFILFDILLGSICDFKDFKVLRCQYVD
jgi:hypothetical protein